MTKDLIATVVFVVLYLWVLTAIGVAGQWYIYGLWPKSFWAVFLGVPLMAVLIYLFQVGYAMLLDKLS